MYVCISNRCCVCIDTMSLRNWHGISTYMCVCVCTYMCIHDMKEEKRLADQVFPFMHKPISFAEVGRSLGMCIELWGLHAVCMASGVTKGERKINEPMLDDGCLSEAEAQIGVAWKCLCLVWGNLFLRVLFFFLLSFFLYCYFSSLSL